MLELLKFPYEVGRTYDAVLDLPTFLGIVTRIETKIYDKSFSSSSSKIEGKDPMLFLIKWNK